MPVDKEWSEILTVVKEMQAALNAGTAAPPRGPLVDPMPPIRGPVADPAPPCRWPLVDPMIPFMRSRFDPTPEPDIFLSKERLARLRVQKIEAAVAELQREIESLHLQRDLLKEEYKLK